MLRVQIERLLVLLAAAVLPVTAHATDNRSTSTKPSASDQLRDGNGSHADNEELLRRNDECHAANPNGADCRSFLFALALSARATDPDTSVRFSRRALIEMADAQLPDDHPDWVVALQVSADSLRARALVASSSFERRDDQSEARSKLVRIVEWHRKWAAHDVAALVKAYTALGDYDTSRDDTKSAAVAYLAAARAGGARSRMPASSSLLRKLASSLEVLAKPKEAEEFRRQAASRGTMAGRPVDSYVMDQLLLARNLAQQERHAEASRLTEHAHAFAKRKLPSDAPELAMLQAEKVLNLFRTERYAEATGSAADAVASLRGAQYRDRSQRQIGMDQFAAVNEYWSPHVSGIGSGNETLSAASATRGNLAAMLAQDSAESSGASAPEALQIAYMAEDLQALGQRFDAERAYKYALYGLLATVPATHPVIGRMMSGLKTLGAQMAYSDALLPVAQRLEMPDGDFLRSRALYREAGLEVLQKMRYEQGFTEVAKIYVKNGRPAFIGQIRVAWKLSKDGSPPKSPTKP
ncbi:hypothetical protein [Sphingomonas sp.]|uniref:hypothetical protein n=1 Tax=Sphingomonas sp. TaxID=28214 RepID=UPI003BAA5055